MAEKIQKNDFIELQFTGKIADSGEVFDTNIEADAKKANFNLKEIKPYIMSAGHKMLIPGFDKDIEGKEVGKNFSVNVKPQEAFGKRDSSLIRMIPLKAFKNQNINPERGMQFSLDGQVVKVLSNSSGRVLVDYNNPLAGKEVTYDYQIIRKVTDEKEKINALQDFLFRQTFDFNVEEDAKKEKKITFKLKKEQAQFEKFIELMAKPFEDILKMKVSVEAEKEKKDNKGEEK